VIAAAELFEELRAYAPSDDRERVSLAKIFDLLRDAADPFTRERSDHITGSAIVARLDGSAFLLVHHRRLDRWLQPGGHVETGDRSVFETACRETQEETGLAALETRFGRRILDVDVHPIPARHGRPAHVHHDIRYLLTASAETVVPQEEEVRGAAWFTLEEALAAGVDDSLTRALTKARSLLAAPSSRSEG
jgi:8-oxo-dGTP pyrophosphatase MutT (NUDIX family)